LDPTDINLAAHILGKLHLPRILQLFLEDGIIKVRESDDIIRDIFAATLHIEAFYFDHQTK
jgi:hypothetical protein